MCTELGICGPEKFSNLPLPKIGFPTQYNVITWKGFQRLQHNPTQPKSLKGRLIEMFEDG